MVEIKSVDAGSIASDAGICAGDYLISINGHDIGDVLDYRFYLTDSRIVLKIHRGAELFDVDVDKDEYDDIGLDFGDYLMDAQHSCRNKCVFCFIDQLPAGMRDTLYFKDDDDRMSFFRGSYVTLTNVSDAEIARIIKMRLSPINVSVHTTNPELRVKMMKNPAAAKIMEQLRTLADAGIGLNCQIVLCRGMNDGAELDRTMRDISSLYPAVQSVSVVPCGITKHRAGLCALTPFSPSECRDIIAQVGRFADSCADKNGCRLFFCGDELYIKGGLELPDFDYYEDFAQLENGVGMITSARHEFERALDELRQDAGDSASGFDINAKRHISIATGGCAYEFIRSSVEKLTKWCYNLKCDVYRIENVFFGENITVAGLLTGADVVAQLTGKELGGTLLLPAV
ncbi:MAG: DUF512 domain-containing protein, partial [Eubacteriales bacterium]